MDKAIETYKVGIESEPDSPLGRFYLIDALTESGLLDEARKVADEIRALDRSIKVSGLIRVIRSDKREQRRFKANLERVGFTE